MLSSSTLSKFRCFEVSGTRKINLEFFQNLDKILDLSIEAALRGLNNVNENTPGHLNVFATLEVFCIRSLLKHKGFILT